jgi:uncharacterized protein (TIGR03435 family)
VGTVGGANRWAPGRIVDKTGLSGKYDFNLEYAGDPSIGGALAPAPALDAVDVGRGGPDIFTALETQLGLKLERTKALLEVLVVDHVDKTPTDN